jgi:hypothetical protein
LTIRHQRRDHRQLDSGEEAGKRSAAKKQGRGYRRIGTEEIGGGSISREEKKVERKKTGEKVCSTDRL